MVAYTTYMPDPTEEIRELSRQVCCDQSTTTTPDRMNNDTKWKYVCSTFAMEGSLFHDIDYNEIFLSDDVTTCSAAMCIADLRVQVLEALLNKSPNNLEYHAFFIANMLWFVRLRERTVIADLCGVDAQNRLT